MKKFKIRSRAPDPTDKHVGARICERRIKIGMTQAALGEALGGLTFQQIQKYEHGLNRIGASRLQQVSIILRVPLSFFFEGTPLSRAEVGHIRVPDKNAGKSGDLVGKALRLVAEMTAADRKRFIEAFSREYL